MAATQKTYARHSEHQLALYGSLDDLATLVCEHLEDALGAGDGALLVFKEPARQRILGALAAAGFEIDHLEAHGRIVQADTDLVLREVVQDGRLDPDRLQALVVPAWESAAGEGRRVHMVTDAADAAWRAHGRQAAEAIEEAADVFVALRRGTLLCNYGADLHEEMDQRTEATLCGHGSTCLLAGRDRLDAAMVAAFDDRFGMELRERLEAEGSSDGRAEHLVLWVTQNRRDELAAFLKRSRDVFGRLPDGA